MHANSPFPHVSRRRFLAGSAATVSALPALLRGAGAAGESGPPVSLAVIGLNSRGHDLLQAFLATRRVRVDWLCDVDSRALAKSGAFLKERQSAAFRTTPDLRELLKDPGLQAVVIATPDHWHAMATILALQARKHVYVEKPLSHNPREGEAIVAAAERHQRVVQVGLQRRSVPWVAEAMQRLHQGELGDLHFARAWYAAKRGSIGKGRAVPVPEWLNYDLWQGPAPDRPYRDNVVHYQWHWFWHWGTGELANNGVHFLDLARWGLQVDHPTRVSSMGGRYHFEDDHETPDTQVVNFEFPRCTVVWEHRSCQPNASEGEATGLAFYGTKGALVLGPSGYRILDLEGAEKLRREGGTPTEVHAANFLDAIADSSQRPNAPALEGHRSTLLCHLGNIAFRSQRIVEVDPATGKPRDAALVSDHWGRAYRPGWELPV